MRRKERVYVRLFYFFLNRINVIATKSTAIIMNVSLNSTNAKLENSSNAPFINTINRHVSIISGNALNNLLIRHSPFLQRELYFSRVKKKKRGSLSLLALLLLVPMFRSEEFHLFGVLNPFVKVFVELLE